MPKRGIWDVLPIFKIYMGPFGPIPRLAEALEQRTRLPGTFGRSQRQPAVSKFYFSQCRANSYACRVIQPAGSVLWETHTPDLLGKARSQPFPVPLRVLDLLGGRLPYGCRTHNPFVHFQSLAGLSAPLRVPERLSQSVASGCYTTSKFRWNNARMTSRSQFTYKFL